MSSLPRESPAQKCWCGIVAGFRAHLTARLNDQAHLSGLSPEDLSHLIDAMGKGMQLEIEASCYDDTLEEFRANLERSSSFGG